MKSDTKENEVETFEFNYISDIDRINMEIQDYINSFGNYENVLSDEYIAFNNKNTELLFANMDEVKTAVDEKYTVEKETIEKANNDKDISKIKNIIDVLKNI